MKYMATQGDDVTKWFFYRYYDASMQNVSTDVSHKDDEESWWWIKKYGGPDADDPLPNTPYNYEEEDHEESRWWTNPESSFQLQAQKAKKRNRE